jgi:hypothetical protein
MAKTDRAVILVGAIATGLGAIQTSIVGVNIAASVEVLQWAAFGCGIASTSLMAGLAYYRSQLAG